MLTTTMRVALVAVAAAAYVPDLDGVGTETPYADLVAAMPNATARRFVQGAHFLENFNHHEAKRSMVAAAEADPDCAMCWWGVSASLGPYLNAPFFTNASDLAEAKFAADRAAALADAPKAAAIAEAAAARYACDVSLASQTAAFETYSDLLAEAHGADQGDDDVAALYAESLLLLDCDFAGYHFYDTVDGALTPTPRVRKALAALRAVVARSAHALAEHLLIHATEETAPGFGTPGGAADGERSADSLAAQFEGSAAQHLIHMSSHTYLRVGRYADGAAANERASARDAAYLAGGLLPYGAGHDLVFLAFSAAMAGANATASAAATRARGAYAAAPDRPDGPDGSVAWHYPALVHVRFGAWDEVAAALAPPPRPWPLQAVLEAYATGLSAFHRGDGAGASAAYDALQAAAARLPADDDAPTDGQRGADVLRNVSFAANATLFAALLPDRCASAAVLRAAAKVQETWTYDEPPLWHLPLRQCEGAAWLACGRPRDAAAAFSADFATFPENAWSLAGLLRAAPGDAGLEKRFGAASAHADVAISSPCPALEAGKRGGF